ncbi:MAG TPA: hypothetical protein VFK69_10760 [Candidatus Eisenbacteria bacterium]|nr:hypothetical protein [Candidatus Eisenbacteria bacterium]
MKRSRRKFLQLMAAGAAAAVATPARGIARTVRRAATRPAAKHPAPARPAGRSEALAAEIEKQKGYVSAALKTIRTYELPNGAEQAFVFRPLAPRGKERQS